MTSEYISFGNGKKGLVIIPGLSLRSVLETPELLERIFACFTQDWRVYVIDRPSGIPDGTTNRDLAHACAEVMKSAGSGPCDIIGVSQGGMIAQHLAVDYPELVSCLVLVSTLSRMNETAQATFDTWISLAQEGRWTDLNNDIFARLYTAPYIEKNKSAFDMAARMIKPDVPEQFIRMTRACMTGGPYERLSEIKCPMMVYGSESDAVLTAAGSYEIAAATGCPLKMFSDYGHAVYDEKKDFYGQLFNGVRP